ncbi:MAG: hypothetical protein ABI395_02535 [Sphingobium sp.]
MEEYVRHLRAVGIAQIKRRAKARRIITPHADKKGNLPKYVHSRTSGVDAEELVKLEERIARDSDIVARNLFAHPMEQAAIEPDEESGLTKERIRQITRRAARVMAELASGNPRFAANICADTGANHRVDPPTPLPDRTQADIYPVPGQPHNRLIQVRAAECAGPEYSGENVIFGNDTDNLTAH